MPCLEFGGGDDRPQGQHQRPHSTPGDRPAGGPAPRGGAPRRRPRPGLVRSKASTSPGASSPTNAPKPCASRGSATTPSPRSGCPRSEHPHEQRSARRQRRHRTCRDTHLHRRLARRTRSRPARRLVRSLHRRRRLKHDRASRRPGPLHVPARPRRRRATLRRAAAVTLQERRCTPAPRAGRGANATSPDGPRRKSSRCRPGEPRNPSPSRAAGPLAAVDPRNS